METDKQLFLIIQANPEWFFDLIAQQSPGECRMRSETFKALQRTPDVLIEPTNPKGDLFLAEFQLQLDPEIYLRVVEAMTGAQRKYGMRRVRGAILFGSASLDPKTEPWNSVVETYVLRDCIVSLEQRNPTHPLVALFKPLLEPDEAVLERKALDYYRSIKNSPAEVRQVDVLLEVFVSWLEQRFPERTKKEIEMLLIRELPPLEETRSGKDLIEIGEQRGEKRGRLIGEKHGRNLGGAEMVVGLLESRFRRVPRTLINRISKLEFADLKALNTHAVLCNRINEVKEWLDSKGV